MEMSINMQEAVEEVVMIGTEMVVLLAGMVLDSIVLLVACNNNTAVVALLVGVESVSVDSLVCLPRKVAVAVAVIEAVLGGTAVTVEIAMTMVVDAVGA